MALAGEDGAYRLGIALGHQLGRRKLTRRDVYKRQVWAQRGGGRGALALLERVECDGQVGPERALHNRCW